MYVGARMAALEEKRLMTERGGKINYTKKYSFYYASFLRNFTIFLLISKLFFFQGRLAVLKKKREIIAMKKLSRLMQDQRFG